MSEDVFKIGCKVKRNSYDSDYIGFPKDTIGKIIGIDEEIKSEVCVEWVDWGGRKHRWWCVPKTLDVVSKNTIKIGGEK